MSLSQATSPPLRWAGTPRYPLPPSPASFLQVVGVLREPGLEYAHFPHQAHQGSDPLQAAINSVGELGGREGTSYLLAGLQEGLGERVHPPAPFDDPPSVPGLEYDRE